MIYGFRDSSGKFLPDTRVSTTTYIGCKKKLSIGNNVFIGHFNFLDSCNGLIIEEGCQITNYVSILTHSSHIPIRLYGRNYTKMEVLTGMTKSPVRIGAYTFIGPHVVIMPGSDIGKGCIISAFSLVRGNIPDFSIVRGNPGQIEGSTRNLDKRYLERDPELRKWYSEWTGIRDE